MPCDHCNNRVLSERNEGLILLLFPSGPVHDYLTHWNAVIRHRQAGLSPEEIAHKLSDVESHMPTGLNLLMARGAQ